MILYLDRCYTVYKKNVNFSTNSQSSTTGIDLLIIPVRYILCHFNIHRLPQSGINMSFLISWLVSILRNSEENKFSQSTHS